MAARKKTATKTAKPSPRNGNVLPVGAHPGNTGGKKGRSGRPPDAFKAMCRDLANSDEIEKQLRAVLKNPDNPAFMSALKWASEHGFGKPTQILDVQVTDKRAERMAAARERANA